VLVPPALGVDMPVVALQVLLIIRRVHAVPDVATLLFGVAEDDVVHRPPALGR
jgi:hypothetical protein